MATTEQASNKKTAQEFLRLVTAGHVRQAYDNHVAPTFKHHNPYFPQGAEPLRAGMEANEKEAPNKVFEMRRAIAEDDLVAVHSSLLMKANGPAMAVVHIFRFVRGQIVELWDIGQLAPVESPNSDGMF